MEEAEEEAMIAGNGSPISSSVPTFSVSWVAGLVAAAVGGVEVGAAPSAGAVVTPGTDATGGLAGVAGVESPARERRKCQAQ